MIAPRILHLMRHGEPALAGRMLGHTDCDATHAGIAACTAAAAGLSIGGIVTSDLRRAAACAEAVAGPLPIHTDPRWRELDFGDWDGQAPASLPPTALAHFWDDPDAYPPPQGERWSDLVARIRPALADLPTDTLVVTHAGAIRAALAAACGFDHRQVWAFDLPYAALLTLRIWPDATAQISGLRT